MQREALLNQPSRWRTLIRFDKGKIAPDIAVRNTIGIVIPLIVGAVAGNPSAGAVGAIGALNVCYSDSRDPYIARLRRMLMATALVGIAVTLGAIAGRTEIAAVTAAAAWAFGAGMLVLFSPQASNLGVTTLVTLVVFAARKLTPLEAVETGLVAVAGGLLQTLLAIAFWPVHRYEPERRIIASLYRAVAGLAVSPAGSGGAPPATVQLAETQTVLNALAGDHSAEGERLTFLVNQAERVRLTLLTLRRLWHRIGRDPNGAEAAGAVERILSASSSMLDDASRAITGGTTIFADDFGHTAAQIRKLAVHAPSPFMSAMLRDANYQIDALGGQLRTIRALLEAPTEPAKPKVRIPAAFSPGSADIGSHIAVLRANLSLQSAAFRHALRLAVCVAAGEGLSHIVSFQRTYWLTMTIAIVLRPDFTATFTRGILRVAGTLIGLLVATGLFLFVQTGKTGDIVLLALFAFLLRWIGPANYGIFVTAISAFVVLLIAITGVSPGEVIAARALNTIVGGAIALAAYRIWPTWERTLTGPVLADLLEAYKHYFRAVIDAYVTGSGAETERNRTRMKARLARSNAQALIDRVAAEPGTTPDRANLLSGMLASAHNFVRAVMALDSGLYLKRPDRVRPATIEFATEVDATLQTIADSFRSSMVPARLPDLRAAHNAILASANAEASQYTLINTEADRITTTVNTLTEQATKWLQR